MEEIKTTDLHPGHRRPPNSALSRLPDEPHEWACATQHFICAGDGESYSWSQSGCSRITVTAVDVEDTLLHMLDLSRLCNSLSLHLRNVCDICLILFWKGCILYHFINSSNPKPNLIRHLNGQTQYAIPSFITASMSRAASREHAYECIQVCDSDGRRFFFPPHTHRFVYFEETHTQRDPVCVTNWGQTRCPSLN